MDSDLVILKKSILKFFKAKLSDSQLILFDDDFETNINHTLFELEHFIQYLKKRYKINLKLNAEISSKNILESFSQHNFKEWFRPTDYQYNFLHYELSV